MCRVSHLLGQQGQVLTFLVRMQASNRATVVYAACFYWVGMCWGGRILTGLVIYGV